MALWLLKTEPETYSWQDLVAEGKTTWEGVKGGLALKNLARMRPGEEVFIYHTGRERSIVGLAKVAGKPYQDPQEPDSRMLVIDLLPLRALDHPVELKEIKRRAAAGLGGRGQPGPWEGWELLRMPRLSVVPVSEEQWKAVLEISRCSP